MLFLGIPINFCPRLGSSFQKKKIPPPFRPVNSVLSRAFQPHDTDQDQGHVNKYI